MKVKENLGDKSIWKVFGNVCTTKLQLRTSRCLRKEVGAGGTGWIARVMDGL